MDLKLGISVSKLFVHVIKFLWRWGFNSKKFNNPEYFGSEKELVGQQFAFLDRTKYL